MKKSLQKSAAGMRLKLHSKRKCSGTILTMIMVFFMITFIVTVGEFYRIHILQQDIEYLFQRRPIVPLNLQEIPTDKIKL